MKRCATVLAAVTLAAFGCKRDETTTLGKGPNPANLDTLLAGVPGEAMGLGFVQMNEPPWDWIVGGAFPLEEATRKALDKELRDHLDRHLGIDLSKLQYAVGFVSGPIPRGAMLARTIRGTLKLSGGSAYEGGTMWPVPGEPQLTMAVRGEVFVLGKEDAVREVLETLAAKRRNVLASNRPLVDWLRQETRGAMVGFAANVPKHLVPNPQIAGLERFALSMGRDGLRVVVEGDADSISFVQDSIEKGLAKLVRDTEQAKQAAIASPSQPMKGAVTIIGAAYARSYLAKLRPRREGNRLVTAMDFVFGVNKDAMTVTTMIGIMAAVAIPAFMSRSSTPRDAVEAAPAYQLNP